MQEESSKVKKALETANTLLDQIDTTLEQLMSVEYATMGETLSHKDFANVNLNLAYALNTLYYSIYILHTLDLLQLKGKNPREHEVTQEMKLIEAAFDKFDSAQRKANNTGPKIDKEATSRIMKAALPSQGRPPTSRPSY